VVERVSDLPAGVLGFRASGKITRDEYQELMKPIYEALGQGKKLNIYFELAGDFEGLDFGALWEDLKAAGSVGLKHRSSWQRMAVVTDKDWIRHGAAVFGPLAPGELRVFGPAETTQAKAWVAEPLSA
jgi:SpoIIAA-like